MNFLSRTAFTAFRHTMAFSTQVLRCNPNAISFPSDLPEISCSETRASLETASHQLTDQHLAVVIPTETVYGLAASALHPAAISSIFATKGRPADNPLIVHVSSYDMLQTLLPPNFEIPWSYRVLMKTFWPGPLTLLFPCNRNVPSTITANLPTIAIRMPSHPVARALIAMSKTPLAAPSANSSGKPSPTKAEHVLRDLGGKIATILDGGSCGVGLESTVVDGLHDDGVVRVLRPGGVTVEDIESTLQENAVNGHATHVLVHGRDFRDGAIEAAPTTPGMKYRHYSPSVPVTLIMGLSEPPDGITSTPYSTFIGSLTSTNRSMRIGLMVTDDTRLPYSLEQVNGVEWVLFPLGPSKDLSVVAHRLFDGLLTLERQGVDHILVEEVSSDKEGLAIMNRVKKAAGNVQWISL